MSNPIIAAIPLRIQLAPISNPPVAPVDTNTGEQPRIFKGQTAALQLACFTAQNVCVDWSNLAYIVVAIQEAQDSALALAVKRIDAADITDTITIADWLAGAAQQAQAIFDGGDTDLPLAGDTERDLWLSIVGYTGDGAPLIYGAGPITVELAAAALPFPNPRLTSFNRQETDAGNFTVQPGAPVHTEIVTVGGVARTSSGILSVQGALDGAHVWLKILLPATPAIILEIRSGIVTNPPLIEVETGDVLNMLLHFVYDADNAAWTLLEVQSPAT